MGADEQTAADLADECDRMDEAAAQDVWEEMRTLAEERDAATARAEAAEQRAEAAEAALAAALDDVELERGRVEALEGCIAVRAEALDEAHAEVAQARTDRTLLTGLWLATVPPDVLPTLLPADPGDRDRLAAALDAVDLQASAGSHTAAGCAVIGRIVAETAGGAR